ncbi:MAG TPA: phenylalanine--tRNA ligase subunit beta, partial [Polyangiaceae bacterium]|nr:phenylalanine--tRNA ligase subunit beta [Polyangiaceae bacterium]
MRVSHNWLQELLPSLALTPAQLSARLTALGLEVESVTEHGGSLAPLKVVRVVQLAPHPKRDKLQLVTVDLGGSTQQVVCGASNVPKPGGLVVLAPLGTHLPAVGLTLTPREIGGVLSEGMLCSETELGLSEKSDGIIVLPENSIEPGTGLLQAFPEVRDTVYELGITPNRPDALGHVGVARDLAAALNLTLTLPGSGKNGILPTLDATQLLHIDNREPARCPRYGASVVSGVAIGPSPSWMRWRLTRLGVRPISNVVDVTNWLLLEFGHPMHAFDLDLLRGKRIVIRRAQRHEAFTTLDGQARTLNEDDLLICDAEGAVALAGVMGGANTEIRANTQDVLLECAYFDPPGIRRASRRHALHSESSHRFERGVNPNGIAHVLQRAKGLLFEIAGARAVSGER